MTQLVVVGAGGHGREVLDVVEAINDVEPTYDVLGVVDDGEVDRARLARRGIELLGPTETVRDLDAVYVLGIGTGHTRARLDEQLTGWGCEAVTLVHPMASIASDNRLAPGIVLAAGARVTTNVTLGRHTHLNVNAVVSHDCVVGDYVTLSPGAMVNGDVILGDRAFLGTGAVITPQRRVGEGAVVGAGAVVVADVAAGTTAVGVPARRTGGLGAPGLA